MSWYSLTDDEPVALYVRDKIREALAGVQQAFNDPIKVDQDSDLSPNDELWVTAAAGQQLIITALHEPAGGHSRVKLTAVSQGTLLVVPDSGLIDDAPNYPITTPGVAIELSSDGTDFAVF